MIARLSGLLLSKTTHSVTVEAGGVGYEVLVPLSTFYGLPDENEKVSLHIYTHVREDAFLLFGFRTPLEKSVFQLLITISGIGPKLAVNILSGIGPEDLLKAVVRGDAARIQAIPGVGKKTAERIALELRDKASRLAEEADAVPRVRATGRDSRISEDAVSALANLGYSSKAAKSAVSAAQSAGEGVSLEALIRKALQLLA